MKVKVGPITAQYKGKAVFLEKDDAAHKAVLEASGRDTRGQGNANATITALLEPAGEGTKVTVTTDLTVTGKVAQFGRGVLADVSTKLLGQFVDNLEQTVLADDAAVVEEAAEIVEEAESSPRSPPRSRPRRKRPMPARSGGFATAERALGADGPQGRHARTRGHRPARARRFAGAEASPADPRRDRRGPGPVARAASRK